MTNRKIKDFKPNTIEGKILARKRIRTYSITSVAIFILEAVAMIILFLLTNGDQFKILGLILTVLNILAIVTVLVIFDFGPANKLKKSNFKRGNITLEKGHTYYWALKYSGLIKFIINSSLASLILIFAIIGFLF